MLMLIKIIYCICASSLNEIVFPIVVCASFINVLVSTSSTSIFVFFSWISIHFSLNNLVWRVRCLCASSLNDIVCPIVVYTSCINVLVSTLSTSILLFLLILWFSMHCMVYVAVYASSLNNLGWRVRCLCASSLNDIIRPIVCFLYFNVLVSTSSILLSLLLFCYVMWFSSKLSWYWNYVELWAWRKIPYGKVLFSVAQFYVISVPRKLAGESQKIKEEEKVRCSLANVTASKRIV